MKYKSAFWILCVILAAFIALYEMQLNNAFEPKLSIHASHDIPYQANPGDTLDISIPISNSSWKELYIIGKTGSCRVIRVSTAETLEPKTVDRLNIRIAAPSQPGEYSENVVLRTNAKEAFVAVSLRYIVRSDTAFSASL